MSTNDYVDLGCDVCGLSLEIGGQKFWDTSDCARAEAEDEGWECYIGSGDDEDHCPACNHKKDADTDVSDIGLIGLD